MIIENKLCECGKVHKNPVEKTLIGKKAINKIPGILAERGIKKVFLIADINTFQVAGDIIKEILEDSKVETIEYVFKDKHLEPDEKAVGSAFMHFDITCDAILAIGSGVINDIGKILANTAGKFYIIVATAPSMDGYASASSSMTRGGLKVSLPSKCADVIVGDIDILKHAPKRMLVSGIGDMLAKYISICEWRISNIITGEYYCENIAKMVREALKKCVLNADGLLKRDEKAVEAVFQGLILGGVAMNYAGISRPASGVEHYISHIWDMRALEFGTKVDFHGIQCAVGTMYAARIYEKIKKFFPDRQKAIEQAAKFDYEIYTQKLKDFLGKSAEDMICLEEKEQKYDIQKHKKRIENIINNWDRIVEIINEEIPSSAELKKIYQKINMPLSAKEICIDENLVPMTFEVTKDIRDKYVLSRLCWDLGILDDIKQNICFES